MIIFAWVFDCLLWLCFDSYDDCWLLLMIVLEILLSLIYVFESFDACFDCIFWLLIVVDDCYVYVLRVLLLTILNTYVFKRKIVRLYENSMFLGSSNQLLLSVIDYHRAGPAIDY